LANATKFRLSVQTHQGMIRKNNEDAFSVTKPGDLKGFVMVGNEPLNLEDELRVESAFDRLVITVADGMGGANAGEVAAKIAVETINETILVANPATPVRHLLLESIEQANQKIVAYSETHPLSSGMGTTCVIALVEGCLVHIAWIGDSRAYIFNPETGLTQLSKDHSLVQELIDMKQLTPEEGFYHPDSNIITQSLGDPDRVLDPGFLTVELHDDDIVILCSDGLNSMLQDREIAKIIESCYLKSADEIAANLITAANEEGGQDNTTVAVYQRTPAIRPSENAFPLDSEARKTLELRQTVSPFGDTEAPPSSLPKFRGRRLWLLIIAITLVTGGLFFLRQYQQDTQAALLQKENELNRIQDSIHIEQYRQDSILKADELKRDSIQALESLSWIQITSNNTDSTKAQDLNWALGEGLFQNVNVILLLTELWWVFHQ
jgi:PPM family protein phosphatase